jgi:conjugal transfer/entry exclusion protein
MPHTPELHLYGYFSGRARENARAGEVSSTQKANNLIHEDFEQSSHEMVSLRQKIVKSNGKLRIGR